MLQDHQIHHSKAVISWYQRGLGKTAIIPCDTTPWKMPFQKEARPRILQFKLPVKTKKTRLKTFSASRQRENLTWKINICPKLNYKKTFQYSLTYDFPVNLPITKNLQGYFSNFELYHTHLNCKITNRIESAIQILNFRLLWLMDLEL